VWLSVGTYLLKVVGSMVVSKVQTAANTRGPRSFIAL